jgi:hypothetical protein
LQRQWRFGNDGLVAAISDVLLDEVLRNSIAALTAVVSFA